jgi:hypothetical protein
MTYILPFESLKALVHISSSKGELRISASYEEFLKVIKSILLSVSVEEEWYLKQHEDVAKAIKAGEVGSARQHFIESGYFEGRLPGPIKVDEEWYLKQNPDVRDSVRKGVVTSAQEHFEQNGYREGRLPFLLPGRG